MNLFRGKEQYSEKEVKEKAEAIIKSSSTYEALCWLVSEIEILINKQQL
ncbi:MAG: hypothetical protein ACXAEX_12810 [Promethearchaeota archaeon]